jgi:hypothetical protein
LTSYFFANTQNATYRCTPRLRCSTLMVSKVRGLVPVDVCAAARASIIDEVMQVAGTDGTRALERTASGEEDILGVFTQPFARSDARKRREQANAELRRETLEEVGLVRAGECDHEAEELRIARRELRQHQQSLQEMPGATRQRRTPLREISPLEAAESATKTLGPRERF